MNISNPVIPGDLFSAKGLVIVITGGGTGTKFKSISFSRGPSTSLI